MSSYIFAATNIALCVWSIAVGVSSRSIVMLIPTVATAAAAGLCVGAILGATP